MHILQFVKSWSLRGLLPASSFILEVSDAGLQKGTHWERTSQPTLRRLSLDPIRTGLFGVPYCDILVNICP